MSILYLPSVEDRKISLTKAVRTSSSSIQPQVAPPEIKGKVFIPDAFVKETTPPLGGCRAKYIDRNIFINAFI